MSTYSYKYFNVTFPFENVAHVEINRADKLNAFHTEYAPPPPKIVPHF